MFGGDCCSPIACLNMARTVTMNGKQVTMIAMPGTSDSTVIRIKSWTDLVVSDPSSPSEIDTSCASAGDAHIAPIATTTLMSRNTLMEVTIVFCDFGQFDRQLPWLPAL